MITLARAKRAGQTDGCSQFGQDHFRFGNQLAPQPPVVGGQDAWLASGPMVLCSDLAQPAALLEQLLDHAQRYPEAPLDHRAHVGLMIWSDEKTRS